MPKNDMAKTEMPRRMMAGHPCILLRIACSIEIFPQRGCRRMKRDANTRLPPRAMPQEHQSRTA
jgi:hypothetical protein